MAQQRKKRIRIIFLYPVVAVLCILGAAFFALLYQGGGATPLLGRVATPSGEDTPEASPTPGGESDALNIGEVTPVPSPTAAPSLEGRLFPFRYGELWGYKNGEGRQVIEPKYLHALEFTDGLYAFAAVEQNGRLRYGMITRSGTWAFEPSWGDVRPFSEGYAAVEMDDKWGYIDTTGKLIIPCKYREAGDFHNGRAAVREASNFGYIDPDGDIAIAASFSKAGDFASDMAFVMQDNKCYSIDKVGEKITSWGSDTGEVFSEGYAVIKSGNDYSYYDTSRRRRYRGFEGARPFSGGYAAVKRDGLWGYIGSNGEMEIAPAYQEAGDFAGRRAAIRDESGKWGYIDHTGTQKVECLYDEAGQYLLGYAVVKKGSETGIVDDAGNYTALY